ncbi:MAG: hypothetical protein KatS3mg105_4748 [Gemmatales bacterium]|nr:MAG: hypothetical protein KatS3mg105_4748 [Gemmatales bacterium]
MHQRVFKTSDAVTVHYRTFRNDDPPALVEIWNSALTGRSAAPLRSPTPLEWHALSKPYFDPAGLIVAVDNSGTPVGFAHAGFGPNRKENGISYSTGITCMIAVRPECQRRGIGSELLGRCEEYLMQKGAKTIYAGPVRPLAPFYFGLYGGSDLPGFLATDEAAAPFLEYHGYSPSSTCLVFQRYLDQPINIADARFSKLRQRYHVRVMPPPSVGTWWHECVWGPIEPHEFRLEEIIGGRVVARAQVWEMEGFSWRWGIPVAGIINFLVREDLRRKGIGKFLLVQILKHLQEQYFGLVEVQTMERNQGAVELLKKVGFQKVDFGRTYKQLH